MWGHLGFSYLGLIFLALLMIPNLVWARRRPVGYSSVGEGRLLSACEQAGQVSVTCILLIFRDFNPAPVGPWLAWLAAALLLMLLYEVCWLRYFRTPTVENMYRSLLGIPVPLASLPVAAVLLLGVYGRVIWLFPAAALLGIGHIGIHLMHRKQLGVR